MKIKALTSFSGSLSMRQGEEREVSEERAKELVDANFAVYLEDVSEEPDANEETEKIAPVQSKKSKKVDKNAD